MFASAEPLEESSIAARLSDGADVGAVMEELRQLYAGRGVNLVRVARRWTFRTAEDLSWLLAREGEEKRKLSRAALETLAIVAYHQPVTRADIEEIRGVAVSKGALDVLMEAGWVRMRGRRKAPGRPITYGTTTEFLIQFGLDAIGDLPGLDELQAAGLFDGKLPTGYGVPQPERRARAEGGRGPARRARGARPGLGSGSAGRQFLSDDGASRKRRKREGLCVGLPPRRDHGFQVRLERTRPSPCPDSGVREPLGNSPTGLASRGLRALSRRSRRRPRRVPPRRRSPPPA